MICKGNKNGDIFFVGSFYDALSEWRKVVFPSKTTWRSQALREKS